MGQRDKRMIYSSIMVNSFQNCMSNCLTYMYVVTICLVLLLTQQYPSIRGHSREIEIFSHNRGIFSDGYVIVTARLCRRYGSAVLMTVQPFSCTRSVILCTSRYHIRTDSCK